MDITIIRGRTARFTVNLTQDGEPYEPQAGEKLVLTVKHKTYDTEPILQKEGPVFTFTAAETAEIEEGLHLYDVVLIRENAEPKEVYTVVPIGGATGNFIVRSGVYE
jgi:hypothetical protein